MSSHSSDKAYLKYFCNFCGKSQKETELRELKSVPERWGLYVFCKNGTCTKYYDNYIYKHDLSQGLPYALYIKNNSSPILQNTNKPCLYCGLRDNTISFPWKAELVFCHNKICYKDYLCFCKRKSQKTSTVSNIPYFVKTNLISKYNNNLHDYLFSKPNTTNAN